MDSGRNSVIGGFSQDNNGTHRFGKFRLDASDRRLWCKNEPVSLTPKQFDLLFYFVENAGRTTKKSDLLDAVWADTYVEETTLARNVSWLREKLAEGSGGRSLIETVPKIGYRFTADATFADESDSTLIIEEHTVQHVRAEETITISDAFEEKMAASSWTKLLISPRLLVASLLLIAFVVSGSVIYTSNFIRRTSNNPANASADKATVRNSSATADRRSENAQIKIGSVVHLRNDAVGEPAYLDVWGLVRNKPEFAIVPTELMFVSTHPNPDRDNGSGSWEIVSATGKKDGEPLVYGDKIHLRSKYPDAGYLDNCGWIKDMPVFKNFNKIEKFAVFTAYSEERDNGSGTWIVGSDTEFAGTPVLEEDFVALQNGFPAGGFLNTVGSISDVPAFNDYDGSRLVFIHESTIGRRPESGVWVISLSRSGQ